MTAARAFVFAAEEDFGIVVVEAQAHGTPVIALGRGGARETVVASGHSPTGIFFESPDPASIVEAVQRFNDRESDFKRENCHTHARRYSTERFESELKAFVDLRLDQFRHGIAARSPFQLPIKAAAAVVQSVAA